MRKPRVLNRLHKLTHFGGHILLLALVAGIATVAQAADGRIDAPLPSTATNGALHYQRGLLFLNGVDPEQRAQLNQPIWELLGGLSDPDRRRTIEKLLIDSRHAVRSALVGSRQMEADFGIDLKQYAIANFVPHADQMVDLHKLVLLHGAQRESIGESEEAVEIYVQGLRMGRHLTHSATLVEALAGLQMLEGNYYLLSSWALRCKEPELVEQASRMINVLTSEMADPARSLFQEFRIVKLQLAMFGEVFPDGPWAEMVLEALDAPIPMAGEMEMQQAARAAAAERGLPANILDDEEAFAAYLEKLKALYLPMARQTAQALSLPPVAAVERGQEIHDEFADKLQELGDPSLVNPGEVASYFAMHDAELTLAKVVIALAASKTEEGFPPTLDAMADRFGGEVPRSPYDGSPLTYELLDGGRGFHVAVPAAQLGAISLQKIDFRHDPGATAR